MRFSFVATLESVVSANHLSTQKLSLYSEETYLSYLSDFSYFDPRSKSRSFFGKKMTLFRVKLLESAFINYERGFTVKLYYTVSSTQLKGRSFLTPASIESLNSGSKMF